MGKDQIQQAVENLKHGIKTRREEKRKEMAEVQKYHVRYQERKKEDMKNTIENNEVTRFFKQRKEERECTKMQYMLHLYFDLNGLGLSQQEITQINEYIKHTMVLNDSEEMKNFKKHITMMSNINGGMESYKKDRDRVIKLLDEGKIVTKSDACIAAARVIMNDCRISVLKGIGDQLVEMELHPFNIHAIEVNPDEKQPITKIPYNAEMEAIIRRFKDVRSDAFHTKTVKVKQDFDIDKIEQELDEQLEKKQEIFHKYFDLSGKGLTQEEIDLVNSHIRQSIALTQPTEIKNFEKHIYTMAEINGGMEAFAEDRKRVKAKLDAGEIITKTDASILASSVVVKNGDKTYILEVQPKAKNPISRVNNPRFVTLDLQLFDKVRTQAFNNKTM